MNQQTPAARRRRHQRTGPARGRRPGHLPGRAGPAAGPGEGAHPRRRRDRRGPAAPAHGRGRRQPRADRTRTGRSPCSTRSKGAGSSSPTTSCGTRAGSRPSSAKGCTWVTTQVTELSYLHSRDITYAVFCQGPLRREHPLPRLHGLGHAVVLSPGLPRRAARRPPDRPVPPRLLPARRRPRLRDLLDEQPRRRGAWTTATRSWTSPCTDARSRGRTRPPAGRNSAPTRGLTAARPLGHQCQRGRKGAPSPSGRDSKPDALTTSPSGPDRQWRGALLNAERSFRRLKGHHQMPLLVAAPAECDASGGRSWRGHASAS